MAAVTAGVSSVEINASNKAGRSGSFEDVKEEQADSLLMRRHQRSNEFMNLKELTTNRGERVRTAPSDRGVHITGTAMVTRPVSSRLRPRVRHK